MRTPRVTSYVDGPQVVGGPQPSIGIRLGHVGDSATPRPAQMPRPHHEARRVRQRHQQPQQAPLRHSTTSFRPTSGLRDVLTTAQRADQLAYRDSINPAQFIRDIPECQGQLHVLAKHTTEKLHLDSLPDELARRPPRPPSQRLLNHRRAGIPTRGTGHRHVPGLQMRQHASSK